MKYLKAGILVKVWFTMLTVTLALAISSCDQNNQSIFHPDTDGKSLFVQGAALFPVPVHREYLLTAPFAKTEEHLSVFLAFPDGTTQKIPLEETEIMLEQYMVANDTPHTFKSIGQKEVAISYETLNASYTVMVRNGIGNGDDDDGNGDDGNSTESPSGDTSLEIEIKWE
ncbi:MAG: hypothetical protein LBD74_04395 [Spirochaetaceae bacterium]|jgi:hypothetical protein|nr:hypothetical protein [Spirochaetaceae bacterium]